MLCGALTLGVELGVGEARAEWLDVPIRLQAELLGKVVAYDRAFAARAGSRVLVLVLIKVGDAVSERIGAQMLAELGVLAELGGLPHVEEAVSYSSPAALARLVKRRAPAVIYVSAGLSDAVESIARVLDGQSVLSVGALASYVPRRVVLGFDIDSGKPKLVVHLDQARRQHVAFRPELLKLSRVIQ